ncbi:hypothetical protein LMG29542_07066 [Paraburkholderia humisilvae]|uniref:Uncharacterized protein n=1 Tax=Paraburkholderia humisilvae TaxID=627669 RepID=A0A6J5F2E5_9BURK|nr:hypothetical protein LMG29542_07066 [Paraburkholderia humisilvae]
MNKLGRGISWQFRCIFGSRTSTGLIYLGRKILALAPA